MVVIEDQERIARDLHDTVIQRLFAIGMSLQATMRVVTDSGANDRLSRAVDELDITIRHIRTVIFGLESESSATRASVRSRVLEISTEAARVLGFQPSVSFAGPIETSGYEAITDELLSTLREALSNVARHAKARRVTIEVVVDGDALRLVVEDDGIGIDLETSGAAAGRGIKNMGSRAQRHGGSMVVGPALNGGTRLVWSLPLRSGTDEVGVAR
jgi:signal transduction histidine kinase